MHIKKISILVFWALCSSSAAENQTPLNGTWTGTIGKAKIIACFQTFDENSYSNGSYYYLKYRQPIALESIEDTLWREPDSCRWIFTKITDSSATGNWIGRDKKSSLPITLSYLGNCDGDEEQNGAPCGCDLFNNPIEKMPALKIDTIKKSERISYRQFSLDSEGIHMEWFQLNAGSTAAKKINEKLRKNYDALENKTGNFYACRRGTLASFGNANCENNIITEPYIWTDNFLEIAEANGGFCGGAHDFSGVAYTTFDLSTGEQVDPESWLKDGADDTLAGLILSKVSENQENTADSSCKDLFDENTTYSFKLDTAGFVYYTEFGHCCRACDTELLITFRELIPFLSNEGKNKVRLLTGQRAAPKK